MDSSNRLITLCTVIVNQWRIVLPTHRSVLSTAWYATYADRFFVYFFFASSRRPTTQLIITPTLYFARDTHSNHGQCRRDAVGRDGRRHDGHGRSRRRIRGSRTRSVPPYRIQPSHGISAIPPCAGRSRTRVVHHQQFPDVAPEHHRHQRRGLDAHGQQQHAVPDVAVEQPGDYVERHVPVVRPSQEHRSRVRRAGRQAVARRPEHRVRPGHRRAFQ